MTEFLLRNGLWTALGCAGIGLIAALWLVKKILAHSPGDQKTQEIAKAIQLGAAAYLNRQVITISVIAVAILAAVGFLLGTAMAVGFLIGAVCSLAAGYIGMNIAVRANCRTAEAARSGGRLPALHVAFNGGAVTGLLVVALALLSVGLFYSISQIYLTPEKCVRSLIGLALGASLISVFARLGGGIYTKAADVGADLVGKIESQLDEDDPKNPATIADNVGDNVGDCAGMAADVFETYAVSLIGAIVIGTLTAVANTAAAVMFPFLLCGISVIGSLAGIFYINIAKGDTTRTLVTAVIISALFTTVSTWPLAHWLFPEGLMLGTTLVSTLNLFYAALVGIAVTILVVLITNYYTSTAHKPVRHIANSCQTGHATNIIAGIGVGFRSTALPVILIATAIGISFNLAGLYGIAIAVVSMLSLSGIIIALDAFGPITDNAGGIAAMSCMDPAVRKITDELDAVGNTMKAVTKGYAIASAGLAALVLFGSYVEELQHHLLQKGITAIQVFDLMDHRVIIGLFLGGLLPYLFSGYTMDAVGNAAQAVVREVRRQVTAKPGILTGTDKPDYGTCVDIVTKAALREMIIPALLPLVFVIGVASIPALGAVGLGGVLVGSIVTGLFLAISMTSSGGAWDNAKKYIEDGHHGGKNSPAHAAAVTGDTVGDPYKDTAGPAINPIIKVVNIVAILIIPLFF